MATAERTAERIEPRAQHEVRALLTRMGDMLTPDELERLCQRVYIRGELWRPLLNLGKDRVCECLYLDTCVGVYLISWSPGDDTELHDHEGTQRRSRRRAGNDPRGAPRPARAATRPAELRAGASFHFEELRDPPHRERQRPAGRDDPLLLAAARDQRDVPPRRGHARRRWPSSSRRRGGSAGGSPAAPGRPAAPVGRRPDPADPAGSASPGRERGSMSSRRGRGAGRR